MSRNATAWQPTGERCGACDRGYVLNRTVFTYSTQNESPVRRDPEMRCSVDDCPSNYARR